MDRYKVILQAKAYEDLDEIFQYISSELLSFKKITEEIS